MYCCHLRNVLGQVWFTLIRVLSRMFIWKKKHYKIPLERVGIVQPNALPYISLHQVYKL